MNLAMNLASAHIHADRVAVRLGERHHLRELDERSARVAGLLRRARAAAR